jgi:glycosyltransferase involved in cell wall biosynthesis
MLHTHTHEPLVTVVIPVYNGASHLAEAIHSVQQSTYRNFEVLLLDDGSQDSSKQMCRAYAKYYPNIRFHSFRKNRGLANVLNWALTHAKGEYICRQNQDDMMVPSRIARQVAYFQSHPGTVLLGSWLKVIDEDGSVTYNKTLATDEDIKKTWLTLSPCWDPSVMYVRKEAIAAGGYTQEYWPADDTFLWYKLGMRGKIANIQDSLVHVKFHREAGSLKHHKMQMISTYRMHRWAHAHIQRASWGTQLFWVCQLIAGYVFPPRFNWWVYRHLKRIIVYRSLYTQTANQVPYISHELSSPITLASHA